MRIVLDTNVFVAAARSATGASAIIVRLVGRGLITPVCTPTLFWEYEAVLRRPEHCEQQGRTQEMVTDLLALLAKKIEPVSLDFRYRPVLLDPDDEMVVEAAMNGRAAAIVSHNVADFRPRYGPPLPVFVWTPQQLLEKIS